MAACDDIIIKFKHYIINFYFFYVVVIILWVPNYKRKSLEINIYWRAEK